MVAILSPPPPLSSCSSIMILLAWRGRLSIWPLIRFSQASPRVSRRSTLRRRGKVIVLLAGGRQRQPREMRRATSDEGAREVGASGVCCFRSIKLHSTRHFSFPLFFLAPAPAPNVSTLAMCRELANFFTVPSGGGQESARECRQRTRRIDERPEAPSRADVMRHIIVVSESWRRMFAAS